MYSIQASNLSQDEIKQWMLYGMDSSERWLEKVIKEKNVPDRKVRKMDKPVSALY